MCNVPIPKLYDITENKFIISHLRKDLQMLYFMKFSLMFKKKTKVRKDGGIQIEIFFLGGGGIQLWRHCFQHYPQSLNYGSQI